MTLSVLRLSTGPTTGGAGTSTATVTTTHMVRGMIMGVYVKYNDSPPAGTTVVALKTTGTASDAPPTMPILTLTNAATSGWFRPRVQEHTVAGAEITDSYDWPVVYDTLTLTVSGANDGDSVDVWVQVETE
jgi:hypothetical protein